MTGKDWSKLIAEIISAFLKVWILMLLWNALMPNIFVVLPTITYWQAFGLQIIFNLLFSDHSSMVSYLRDINNTLEMLERDKKIEIIQKSKL